MFCTTDLALEVGFDLLRLYDKAPANMVSMENGNGYGNSLAIVSGNCRADNPGRNLNMCDGWVISETGEVFGEVLA